MNNAALATKQSKEITDEVLAKINQFQEAGVLNLPPNYSPANALKSTYLLLSEETDKNGKPVLEVCSRASIANSLLKMVVEGLNPIKKQCYFIAYGDKLNYQRSYMGNIHLAKRDAGVKSVIAQPIYEGDTFIYEVDPMTGKKQLVKHDQKLEDIDPDKVKGAYCVIVEEDGSTNLEVMNKQQILTSWNMRKGNGLTPAHEKFGDEMAKRTVINRATKPYINSSDDSELKGVKDDNANSQANINKREDTDTLDIASEDVTDKVIEAPKSEKPADILEVNTDATPKKADDAPF